jgi:hypothetical protein
MGSHFPDGGESTADALGDGEEEPLEPAAEGLGKD